jgi:surface protein
VLLLPSSFLVSARGYFLRRTYFRSLFLQMFYDEHAFNQDISAWDTSSVTNMEYVSNEGMIFCSGALRRALVALSPISINTQAISLSLSFVIIFVLFYSRDNP